MMIIHDALRGVVEKIGMAGGPVPDFVVEHPRGEEHGDYSTNIALLLAKKMGRNPRELASEIVKEMQKNSELSKVVARIEVAGAGFINFTIKQEWLLGELARAVSAPGYGLNQSLKGKKVMVEYTDPNPFKEFHIGHLMSNTIGESLARLMESRGAVVCRANYQGDVGLHVAKSVWGMREKMREEKLTLEEIEKKNLQSRQKFMGAAYAYGATRYEEDAEAQEEMHLFNKKIYEGSDEDINLMYQKGRKWSLEYFETIYGRLGTKFDEYFFESEAGKLGLEVVEEALAKGILEMGEEGAVVYRGEKDGLHTRVFRNKLGLATYEGKELGLAKTKYERFKYDLSYIVTANEITEYFKVLLKVMSKLYPQLAAKTTHMPHGIMKLTTGKMSSRTGKVVTGEGLLNELRSVVLDKMGERSFGSAQDKIRVADQIAVGALKWTVLKQQIGGDIVYDPAKMTNLEGDTGPYVQYTYARAQSVLGKAMERQGGEPTKELAEEEFAVVRWVYRYSEVVETAGRTYSPHLVASYLYELASRYNAFYNKHKIVGGENESLRLMITKGVGEIIKSGLGLLGISAPDKM